jgi:uncharacterized protein DUF1707
VSGLRASDAEREATVAKLRRAHADGRIDTPELEERVERAYAARTTDELARLVLDLPAERPRLQPPRRHAGWWPPRVVPLLVILAIVVGAATHGHVFFVWPLLFFVVFRFSRGLTTRRRLR